MSEKFDCKIKVKFTNESTTYEDGEIDYNLAFDFFGARFNKRGNYNDMFRCDYENVGFDTTEHWLKELNEYSTGEYWLHYNYELVSESWETPHIQYPEYYDFTMVPIKKRKKKL